MPNDSRTFVVQSPIMHGDDVKEWQKTVKLEFRNMKIDCPIIVDGKYGPTTRAFTASLCNALGMNASTVMRNGVTPQLRTRIRNHDFTKSEKAQFKRNVAWRRSLRERYAKVHRAVHRIVAHVITDSWGYHKGIHDGVDIIAAPDSQIYAPVKCKVIDVRRSGWWGKGAPANPNVRAKGDGIVQLEILETVGPFKKGHHIGFGHCEKATVKKGQVVEAGHPIAKVGLANAWHIHFMANDGKTDSGVGTYDPRKLIDYAQHNG